MLIYEFPSSSLRCRANSNLFRRSFESFDQMLNHRMVLDPHTVYPIPAGTRYILLTKNETVRSKDLQATSSNPGSCTCRDKQTTLGRTARAFLQTEQSVYHTRHQTTCGSCVACPTFQCLGHPSFREYSRASCADYTSDPSTRSNSTPKLTTPLVQIPDPTVQIPVFQPPVPTTPPVQHFLPDPPAVQTLLPDPPVVETLEPTLTDDSSTDQIMSSVFGDYSQQGLPPAHTQEPQVLDTVPPLFDESNDLISFWIILKQGWP
ncbi:hypothetical protein TNCV_567861 [Trichonephila clavipes]|nr:hypothetical protein TNCV_567861 [Trichonephila clavipes]